eukprot:scaffold687946_cov189-Attheya_sp.AAC.3
MVTSHKKSAEGPREKERIREGKIETNRLHLETENRNKTKRTKNIQLDPTHACFTQLKTTLEPCFRYFELGMV